MNCSQNIDQTYLNRLLQQFYKCCILTNLTKGFHQISLKYGMHQLDTLHIKNCPEDNFSCHAVGPWRGVELQHVAVKQETAIIVITQGQMVRLTSQAWRQSLHDHTQNNTFDLRP